MGICFNASNQLKWYLTFKWWHIKRNICIGKYYITSNCFCLRSYQRLFCGEFQCPVSAYGITPVECICFQILFCLYASKNILAGVFLLLQYFGKLLRNFIYEYENIEVCDCLNVFDGLICAHVELCSLYGYYFFK